MLILVAQILGVNSNGPATLLTGIREDTLVTGNAVRMIVPQNVPLTCETLVTLPAAEVLTMPVLVHSFSVLATLISIGGPLVDFRDGNFRTGITTLPPFGGCFLDLLGLLLGGDCKVGIIVYVTHFFVCFSRNRLEFLARSTKKLRCRSQTN